MAEKQNNNEGGTNMSENKNNRRKWLFGGGIAAIILLLILLLRSCGSTTGDVPNPEQTPTPAPTESVSDNNLGNEDEVSEMTMYLIGKIYNYVDYGEEFVDEGVRICDENKEEQPEELAKVWTKVDRIDEDGKSHEVTAEQNVSTCEIDTTHSGKYIITYTYKGESGDQTKTRTVVVGENPDSEGEENSEESSETGKPGATTKPTDKEDTSSKDDTQQEQQQPSDSDQDNSNSNDDSNNDSDSKTPDISGVQFDGQTFTYDKTEHSLKATNVPSGITVKYQNNGKVDAGKYLVTAIFYDANGNEIGRLKAWLVIKKASPAMSRKIFEGKEFKYDGAMHYLAVDESKMPEEVYVDHYSNNGRSAVGHQWVTVYFGVYDTRNYEVPSSMKALLTITSNGGGGGDEDDDDPNPPKPSEKKDIDISGLEFEGLEWVYDSKEHSISVVKSTIPKGITSIKFEGNGKVDAGNYKVKVLFTVDGSKYNQLQPISINMVIKKADKDMSGVSFPSRSYKYDGWEYSCYVDETTLPEGVYVAFYEGNKQSRPGVYAVTAYFGVDDPKNYNVPKPMSAKLSIIKDSSPSKEDVDMSGVKFEGLEHVYDGKAHSVNVVSSTLPTGVSILRSAGNGKTDAGTYDVWFYFTVDTNKYNPVDPIKVTMVIKKASKDMSNVVFADKSFDYDGKSHSIFVDESTLPDGVQVDRYVNNGRTEIGSQKVTAYFKVTDSKNFNTPGPKTATLTINKKEEPPVPPKKEDIDISGIKYSGLAVVYDGTPKFVSVDPQTKIPTGIKNVIFEGNGQTAAGEHQITVKFEVTDSTKYNVPDSITIVQNIYDLSNVKFESDFTTETEGKFVITADGKNHGIYLVGVPSGLKVSYEDADGNKMTGKYVQSAVGEYNVTATISTAEGVELDNGNTATLIIKEKGQPPVPPKKEDIDISGIKYSGLAVVYDGTPKFVSVDPQTKIPTGIKNVIFEGNGQTAAGEHQITVKFEVTDTSKYNVPDSITIVQNIYDLSNVKFESDFTTETEGKFVITADGKNHGIYLVGVPSGLKVSYEDADGNKMTGKYVQSAVGEYNVTATISTAEGVELDNGNTATLIIKEKGQPPVVATYKIGVTTNLNEIEVGDEISVSVSISDITGADDFAGFIAVGAKIAYDKDVFELVRYEGANSWSVNYFDESGKFAADRSALSKEDEIILTVVLKAKKATESTTISVTDAEASGEDKVDVYTDDVSTTVKVNEKSTVVTKPSFRISANSSASEIKVGDEVTVTLSIRDINGPEGFEGFIALTGFISYDANVLELVSTAGSENWDKPSAPGAFAVTRSKKGTADETVFTLTFRAKAVSDTTVSITNVTASGGQTTGDVSTADSSASITVKEGDKKVVDLADIEFNNEFEYDGLSHSVTVKGSLPEGVAGVEFGSNNSRTEIGYQTISVSFTAAEGYTITGAPTEVILTITDPENSGAEGDKPIVGTKIDLSDIEFNNEFEYDGSSHSVTVKGSLPEGVAGVEFGSNNSRIESGSQTVSVSFTAAEGYTITGAPTEVILTITDPENSGTGNDKPVEDGKATEVNLSDIEFNNEFEYDGTSHSVTVKGSLPEGVAGVEFGSNNSRIESGSQTVSVSFTAAEGYTITGAPTEVILTITDPENSGTGNDKPVEDGKTTEVNLSDIEFNNEFEYDGASHSVTVKGSLPEGVAGVEFGSNNSRIESGSQTVSVSFTAAEGYTITGAPETVTLSIYEGENEGSNGDNVATSSTSSNASAETVESVESAETVESETAETVESETAETVETETVETEEEKAARLAKEAEEAEKKRLEEEAEKQRLEAEEAEKKRLEAEEAEKKRLEEEAEKQRLEAEEAEKKRLAEQKAKEDAEKANADAALNIKKEEDGSEG